MTYGISIVNGNNRLVLSSDGIVPGYIGKASLVSTVQHGLEDHGYSTYTINHAGPIIPVIQLVENRTVFLRSMSQAGSTWTLTVYCGGSGAFSTNGFETQFAADIFVWGIPTSVSGYGAAIYNAAGDLVGDLLQRPLIPRQKISWDSTTVSEAISGGITTPGILGTLQDFQRVVSGGGPTWTWSFACGGWTMSSGTLTRVLPQTHRFVEDASNSSSTVRRACRAILIDVAGLT